VRGRWSGADGSARGCSSVAALRAVDGRRPVRGPDGDTAATTDRSGERSGLPCGRILDGPMPGGPHAGAAARTAVPAVPNRGTASGPVAVRRSGPAVPHRGRTAHRPVPRPVPRQDRSRTARYARRTRSPARSPPRQAGTRSVAQPLPHIRCPTTVGDRRGGCGVHELRGQNWSFATPRHAARRFALGPTTPPTCPATCASVHAAAVASAARARRRRTRDEASPTGIPVHESTRLPRDPV
jgi:hypothetical protein